MTEVKQVVCINWGTRYGPAFINRLYAMVARNVTPPFTFTCFTDSTAGIRPEVDAQPLPELDVEMPVRTKGIWPKARLWGPELGGLRGPVLFLDLDVVVTGSLDELFTYGDPDDVVLARNPVRPLERLGQTSVFRFPVGKLLPLQERFAADPQAIADEYRFEQRFVTRNAPGGIKLYPRSWILHFRFDCMPTFPLNYVMEPKLPPSARVVIFPGGLHPEHAIKGGWSGATGTSGWEHVRNVASPSRREPVMKYLRHYVRPTPWVGELWRE
jgi:hypothetical protein